MDVIGRASDTPAPPADPSPDLLNLDQVALMVAPADPQGWYLRAAGFDEVHRRLQEVSDEFRKQSKGVDAAWYGSTSDGYSSRVERIAITVDQLLGGPDYGSLLRRAGDALAVGQRRLHDLQLQRDQNPGTDPAPFDEQARQIFTDLAAAYEDIGQTIAGDPALLTGAPAAPVVTLARTGVAQQDLPFDVVAGAGRHGPVAGAGHGGAPGGVLSGVFPQGVPAGPGPAVDGPPVRAFGGGAPVSGVAPGGLPWGRTGFVPPEWGAEEAPVWVPAAAVVPPPSIGRQPRPSDGQSAATVEPGPPAEVAESELDAVPSVLADTGALERLVTEPSALAPAVPTPATPAAVTVTAAVAPVSAPVPAAPLVPGTAAVAATGGVAGTPASVQSGGVPSGGLPSGGTSAVRVPTAPVLGEAPAGGRVPVTTSGPAPGPVSGQGPGSGAEPALDPMPGQPPVPRQPSTPAVLAGSGETPVARPPGGAPGAAEGAGAGAPIAGGGGPIMTTPYRTGGSGKGAAGKVSGGDAPASWAAEDHPFPVLGRRRRPTVPAGEQEVPQAAPTSRLPRLPVEFRSKEEDDNG